MTTWATYYIEKLINGEVIEFRPRGNSMTPIVDSNDLVVVAPVTEETILEKNDVVLCKVKGKHYLHLITAIEKENRYQISNNYNFVNGWIGKAAIFGKLIENKRKQNVVQ
jgi:hypothetical protein